MIYDHIKNICLYKGLTPAIDLALDYLASVTPEVEVGTHLLDLGVKAVVREYVTRPTNELGYEAHRRYIDIQLAVVGTELVRCKPLAQVTETIPYDEACEAARYADEPGIDTVIGDGYFLLVFPEDAHEPGLAPGGVPGKVKKVVMKVPVE
jgi:uncharacterized protein, YhcH/YjgK/YiaL family